MEVNESGTIQVLKRDGTVEPFDARKLTGAMWRAMRATPGRYDDACQLALAVEIYIACGGLKVVSSGAIFEMAVKVLGRVCLAAAAKILRAHRAETHVWRCAMRVHHHGGRVTYWDKAWLSKLTCQSWHLMPRTGRIIVAQIEQELRRGRVASISRGEVVAMVNRLVGQFGLADAVPVTV